MCTKAEKIQRLINDILDYISKEQLYCDLDKNELVKTKGESFLQAFATKNNFSDLGIVHHGITLVGIDRPFVPGEPSFIDFVTEEVKDKFNEWYKGYKVIPLQINQLLCDKIYEKKWKQELYKFPRIIMYSDKKPYFLMRKADNEFQPKHLKEANYSDFFYETAITEEGIKFKENLLLLHTQFTEKEEYSPFKIFFTSNFKNLCAQTFIKFKEPIINIDNQLELKEFIKLCFLIDRAISSYVYSVQDSIYQHKYTKEILKHSKKAAIASIMGRNMSHNIGSHVLSSLDNMDTKIADFHSYLQKRMDLLARVIGNRPSWSEPMYFIGDLLRGFFSQQLLLNHIVKDQGEWKEEKINFSVKIDDDKDNTASQEILFAYKKDKQDFYSWVTDDDFKDFLISIPEGVIGAQAFYVFMESLMRNSAKYGKNKINENTFKIHIEVKKQTINNDSYYKLKVWDNLSICDGRLSKEMQGRIQEKLINEETGELKTASLGIAEMREACEFLIHPYGDVCPAHTGTDGIHYPLWAECPIENNENCADNCNFKYLAYTFNLAKPKMVAIVTDGKYPLPAKADKYGIKLISKEELLTNKGSFQFVLFFINRNKDDILKFIEDKHRILPQRLLLIGDNIEAKEIKPTRRAVLCSHDEVDNSNCEKLILSTYKAWIKNRWLLYKKINLFISFENGKGIFQRWTSKNLSLDGYINIAPVRTTNTIPTKYYKINDDSSEAETLGEINNNDDAGTYFIVYTNHRRLFIKNRALANFFLHGTGAENKKIFEILSTPPDDKFMFEYFILSLIEAGLTKIIIVDERVTESVMEETDLSEDHNCLCQSHCYPMFFLSNKYLTLAIEKKGRNYYNKILKQGLSYKDDCKWNIRLLPNGQTISDTNKPDFIIFHNGIIETILKDLNLTSNFEYLYNLSPSIIITSGCGKISEDIGNKDYPFIEFSVLKENTFPSISKYHLTRSLMNVKGLETNNG